MRLSKDTVASAVIASLLLNILIARGATITVTNLSDTGDGTLRNAIAAAASGDTIVFDPGLAGQAILLTNGALALNSNLTIDGSSSGGITINGNQNGSVFSVAVGVTDVLTALTITNGFNSGGYGGGVLSYGALTLNRCTVTGNSAYLGGGLFNFSGSLMVNECTITGNSASDSGGGIFNYTGILNVNQCTVVSNSANSNYFSGGGGINSYSATMTMTNTIVAGNSAIAGTNIYISGSFSAGKNFTNGAPTLAPLGNYGGPTPTMPPLPGSPAIDTSANTTFSIDQRGFPRIVGPAPDFGAVEYEASPVVTITADSGVGSLRYTIAYSTNSATLTFSPSLIGQTITLVNGELLITNSISLSGPGATNLAVSGNNASRVFNVSAGATVSLSGLTLKNGLSTNGANSSSASAPGGAGAGGGAIFNAGTLNMTNCIINASGTGMGGSGYPPLHVAGATTAGGAGGNGGGVYNQGTLRMSCCSISGNSCGTGGYGGFGNSGNTGGTGGMGGSGGALYNAAGSATLVNCTISGNATGNGGNGGNGGSFSGNSGGSGGNGGNGGSGGGIYNAGTISVTACTICNGSIGGGGGGGIGAYGYGSGGGGSSGYGGGFANAASAPVCDDTIIALNSAGTGPDVYGSFNSTGHNFIGKLDGSSGFGALGDIFGNIAFPKNPMLYALANNGGSSLTLAIELNSPVIDAGDDSLTNMLATDGRGPGFPRFRGLHVDIGAFEFDASLFSPPTIVSETPGAVAIDPVTRLGSLPVNTTVNPNGLATSIWIQSGIGTNYGNASTPIPLGTSANNVSTNLLLNGLAPGLTWHYRLAAGSANGTTFGPDQTASVSVAGDFNGDGIVSAAEFNAVYANYLTNNPWLYLTNVAGLGTSNVTFALSNSIAGVYSVQYSTDLVNWYYLGPALPQYHFTDTNAPATSPRYYRLSYP